MQRWLLHTCTESYWHRQPQRAPTSAPHLDDEAPLERVHITRKRAVAMPLIPQPSSALLLLILLDLGLSTSVFRRHGLCSTVCWFQIYCSVVSSLCPFANGRSSGFVVFVHHLPQTVSLRSEYLALESRCRIATVEGATVGEVGLTAKRGCWVAMMENRSEPLPAARHLAPHHRYLYTYAPSQARLVALSDSPRPHSTGGKWQGLDGEEEGSFKELICEELYQRGVWLDVVVEADSMD